MYSRKSENLSQNCLDPYFKATRKHDESISPFGRLTVDRLIGYF